MSRHTSKSEIKQLGILASSVAPVIQMALEAPGMYCCLDCITTPHQVTMAVSYRVLLSAPNIGIFFFYHNTKLFKRIVHTDNYR